MMTECFTCADYDHETGLCYCDVSRMGYEHYLFDDIAVTYCRSAKNKGMSSRDAFIQAQFTRREELRACRRAGLTLNRYEADFSENS